MFQTMNSSNTPSLKLYQRFTKLGFKDIEIRNLNKWQDLSSFDQAQCRLWKLIQSENLNLPSFESLQPDVVGT